MRTFEFDSVEESFPHLLSALLNEGKEISPRGQLTKEITPIAVTINNPRKRVISSNVRKLNYGFMCSELFWILSGSNNVDFISHYNSQWKNFSDDGKTLNGAYGSRIFNWDSGIRKVSTIEEDENGNKQEKEEYHRILINQFNEAYKLLVKDPSSRQATIVFFDPIKDYRETKDKPCTNLIRFMIRDGKLNMTTFMRSNDIWLGYPYDVFNFTMLQELMAGLLNVEIGKYTHIADSFHIYEMHYGKAQEVIDENFTSIYDDINTPPVSIQNETMAGIKEMLDVESLTRTNLEVELKDIISILNDIEDKYLKSLAAVIALYNFRKHSRSQQEMDILKTFITNEFKNVTSDWKSKI